jgi:hypothetical protein
VQQQFPPPQVVLAPGATWMKAPPVAVLPIWPEKLNMVVHLPSGNDDARNISREMPAQTWELITIRGVDTSPIRRSGL